MRPPLGPAMMLARDLVRRRDLTLRSVQVPLGTAHGMNETGLLGFVALHVFCVQSARIGISLRLLIKSSQGSLVVVS